MSPPDSKDRKRKKADAICSIYLEPLLAKHHRKNPILWEDLKSAHEIALESITTNDAAGTFSQQQHLLLQNLHHSQIQAYQTTATKALQSFADSLPLDSVIRNEKDDEISFVQRCLRQFIEQPTSSPSSSLQTIPNWKLDNARDIVLKRVTLRAKDRFNHLKTATTTTTTTATKTTTTNTNIQITLSLHINIGGAKSMYPWIDTEMTIDTSSATGRRISFDNFKRQVLQVANKINPREFPFPNRHNDDNKQTIAAITKEADHDYDEEVHIIICDGVIGCVVSDQAQFARLLKKHIASRQQHTQASIYHAWELYISRGRMEPSSVMLDKNRALTFQLYLEPSTPAKEEQDGNTNATTKSKNYVPVGEVTISYSHVYLPVKAVKYVLLQHYLLKERAKEKCKNDDDSLFNSQTLLQDNTVRIIFAGKSLQDIRRLADYGVQIGTKSIHAVLMSKRPKE